MTPTGIVEFHTREDKNIPVSINAKHVLRWHGRKEYTVIVLVRGFVEVFESYEEVSAAIISAL